MHPCIIVHRKDTGKRSFIPSNEVRRIEEKEEGCLLFLHGETHPIHCQEPADGVAGSIAQTIIWKETRIIQGQLDAQQKVAKQAMSGLVVPRGINNGN